MTVQIRVKVNTRNSTAVFAKDFAENIVEANVLFLLEKIFLMNSYTGPYDLKTTVPYNDSGMTQCFNSHCAYFG
jgi:hypothetical protein